MVEEKEKEDPGIFGPGGAYAQAFALFNCSMAAATLFGPVLAGWLSQQYGWGTMSVVLGIFAFSGAIPSVGAPSTRLFHVAGALVAVLTKHISRSFSLTFTDKAAVLLDRWLGI